MPLPSLFDVKDAAKFFGSNQNSVLDRTKSGELEAINIASEGQRPRWKICEAAIKAFLDARTTKSKREPGKPSPRRAAKNAIKQYV